MPTKPTETDPLAPTDEDGAALAASVEEIETRAKQTFRLGDRLRGVKLATAKVLVFLDLEAAGAWQKQELVVQRAGALVQTFQDDPEEHALALADFTVEDDKLEELRREAFKSALAIHMRALPQVALEAAKRKATKDFADDSGRVPASSQDAFLEAQNRMLLGQCVTRIVDSTGDEADFERSTLWQDLQNSLPVIQFDRVVDAYNVLMFNDALARAATSEPGF